MFASLAFCKAVVIYILTKDLDSVTAQTAMNMSFLAIISIVGSYVFGAAWEDISLGKGNN